MNVLRIAFGRNVSLLQNTPNPFTSLKGYHTLLSRVIDCSRIKTNFNCGLPSLLSPKPIVETQVCGFKFRAVIKKRCKDCYIVVKDRQKVMLCKTHKRHKTKEIVPKEKDTWIITHKTQGKVRPW